MNAPRALASTEGASGEKIGFGLLYAIRTVWANVAEIAECAKRADCFCVGGVLALRAASVLCGRTISRKASNSYSEKVVSWENSSNASFRIS